MRWKTINTRDFYDQVNNQDTESRTNSSNLGLSPYSVPKAVKIDKGDDELTIEFDYISPEADLETIELTSSISIEVGIQSRRIYKFHISIKKDGAHNKPDQVISDALSALSEMNSKRLHNNGMHNNGMHNKVGRALIVSETNDIRKAFQKV